MAKTGEKTNKPTAKKSVMMCECGEEMKWVRYANSGVMLKYCSKCGTMIDRKGKVRFNGNA